MPLSVARVLVSWWLGLEAYGRSGKGRRFTSVVIAMSSSNYIHIKELDILGYPKSLGGACLWLWWRHWLTNYPKDTTQSQWVINLSVEDIKRALLLSL